MSVFGQSGNLSTQADDRKNMNMAEPTWKCAANKAQGTTDEDSLWSLEWMIHIN
jgi:hypothetical protein